MKKKFLKSMFFITRNFVIDFEDKKNKTVQNFKTETSLVMSGECSVC